MARLIPVIQIKLINGSLCLQWSRGGKQRRLFPGVGNTPEGRSLCEVVMSKMKHDMVLGVFDYSDTNELLKIKYLNLLNNQNNEKSHENDSHAIGDYFDDYCEYKRKTLSEVTYNASFKTFRDFVAKIQHLTLADHEEIVTIITSTYAGVRVNLLREMSCWFEWLIKNKKIKNNYFKDSWKRIEKEKKKKKTIKVFTDSDIKTIVETVSNEHGELISLFILFRALTGCRTSEAVGLRWCDVTEDFSKITFSNSIVYVRGKQIEKSGLKTEDCREIYCNDEIKSLLRSSSKYRECDYVFHRNAKPINMSWFDIQVWNKRNQNKNDSRPLKLATVKRLHEEGLISIWTPFYNLRHYFISSMIQQGHSIVEIAHWVGNSPETAMKHYAALKHKDVQIPSVKREN